ncbi:hypothetical protein Trydic_g15265 [Trypoxylus dichotomus]
MSSISTVKHRLYKASLYGQIAMKKPLLRMQNKRKYLNWAGEQGSKVLWIDESKFEIFGSRRCIFVPRSTGKRATEQRIVPMVAFGGTVEGIETFQRTMLYLQD